MGNFYDNSDLKYLDEYSIDLFEKALNTKNLWLQDTFMSGVFNTKEYAERDALDYRDGRDYKKLEKHSFIKDNDNPEEQQKDIQTVVNAEVLVEELFSLSEELDISVKFLTLEESINIGIGWYLCYSGLYKKIDLNKYSFGLNQAVSHCLKISAVTYKKSKGVQIIHLMRLLQDLLSITQAKAKKRSVDLRKNISVILSLVGVNDDLQG